MEFTHDKLIFAPGDVDLVFSPMRSSLGAETYVLGAFNPALTRLPNGNLLIMVRIAEALSNATEDATITLSHRARMTWPADHAHSKAHFRLMQAKVANPSTVQPFSLTHK